MGTHTATPTEADMRAWARFGAAYSTITRELEQRMLQRHGLTLTSYDALLQLAGTEDGALRNIDLAKRVLLTRSGVTRLVEGLEAQELVCRCECSEDRRGTKVCLTDKGRERLAEASATHDEGVRELFIGRLDADERQAFDRMLARMPGGACDEKSCRLGRVA